MTAIPLTVYGAATCEDTAIARSRFDLLGVPYRYVDIDVDAAGAAEVVRLNGHRVTPTVVRSTETGTVEEHVAEPTIERLDELARAAGAEYAAPGAQQLHGPVITRAIPLRTLASTAGGTFSLASLRGRRGAALMFGHGHDCLACLGYAKQLGRQAPALDEADAEPIIVLDGDADEAATWIRDLGDGIRLLADVDGAWRGDVARAIDRSATDVLLVLVDRFGAPRLVSSAVEGGGLVAPSDATEWLRFVALDCPECSGEIAWPD
ncbi:MAG TPA: redoxin domain-containing protein [Candidatus Limnocylindrales bacterium]|nr:redoxin domain-containing protein [Candidatus Limnocylindrales bacterium]